MINVLTVEEVAAELRCSKAHVYKVIRGQVPGVSILPSVRMGRRVLVLRESLGRWVRANESAGDILDPVAEVSAV
jgi:excisionase family DNA binding protein